MYARVQTLHQPAERLDELTRLARTQLPAANELSGFKGFYYLVDFDNGKALVLSLWETEDDLRQMEADGGSARARTKAETGIEPPPSEIFEVAVHAAA